MISSERIVSNSFEEERDERMSTSSGEGSGASGASLSSSASSSASSVTSKKESKKASKASKKQHGYDPQRFLGDGVSFKAKLIGVRDVAHPRGEKMAQEALHELKTQKKTSGEHKQKIAINITLDGLQLRDEKSKMVLYLHPVHKISFISQDASDSRAFGYIYGSPDNQHSFYAIKTEKAAQQVVMCMRDLFQVAFQLKKSEIVMYRQQQQQQLSSDFAQSVGEDTSNRSSCDSSTTPSFSESETNLSRSSEPSGGVDNTCVLLDLGTQELQKVLENKNTEQDPLVPDMFSTTHDPLPSNDPFFSDPWGYFRSLSTDESSDDILNGLGVDSMDDPFNTDTRVEAVPLFYDLSSDCSSVSCASKDPFNTSFVNVHNVPFTSCTSTPTDPLAADPPTSGASVDAEDKYAALAKISGVAPDTSVESGTETMSPESSELAILNTAITTLAVNDDSVESNGVGCSIGGCIGGDGAWEPSAKLSPASAVQNLQSIFSELDPLGKDKPYVDKKDFFHDLKNPPKKVLNDLMAENGFGPNTLLDFGSVVLTTPLPSPSQVSSVGSSDDDLLPSFPSPSAAPTLPPPRPPHSVAPPPLLPRPFHHRTSTVSPTSSLEDTIMASCSPSTTPSPVGDVVLLPPLPPTRPVSSTAPPIPHRHVSHVEGNTGPQAFHFSSPPIPIPSRRPNVLVVPSSSSSSSNASSSSSSVCSSASGHPPSVNRVQLPQTTVISESGVQDPNNNPSRWTDLGQSTPFPITPNHHNNNKNNREVSQNTINANVGKRFGVDIFLSPPLAPPKSSSRRTGTAMAQSKRQQFRMGSAFAVTVGDGKSNIFRKEDDPFADDDFFAALDSNDDSSTSVNDNAVVWHSSPFDVSQ